MPAEHCARFEKSGCLQKNLDRRLPLRVCPHNASRMSAFVSDAAALRPPRHCHGNQLKVLARDNLITVRTVKGSRFLCAAWGLSPDSRCSVGKDGGVVRLRWLPPPVANGGGRGALHLLRV